MSKTFSLSFISTLVALGGLFAYSFSGAVWTAPTAVPPNNNTPAPLNVGPDAQVKSGNLGTNILAASSSVWSDNYCDSAGENCISQDLLGGGSGGSGNEVVWLEAPQEILSPQASNGTKVSSLTAAGYPANIIRVLLKPSIGSTVSCPGGECITTYGKLSLKQNIAGQTVSTSFPSTNNPNWFTLNSQLLEFVYTTPGSNSASILAYECQGQCLPGALVGTCQVEISWDIDGYAGSKTVTMGQYDENFLTMEYEGQGNDNNLPGYSRYFDEVLASRGWSTGWCNGYGDKDGIVGYMNPYIMNLYQSGFNSNSNAHYVALPMTVGTTRSLQNESITCMGGSTVEMSAEVLSCTN